MREIKHLGHLSDHILDSLNVHSRLMDARFSGDVNKMKKAIQEADEQIAANEKLADDVTRQTNFILTLGLKK